MWYLFDFENNYETVKTGTLNEIHDECSQKNRALGRRRYGVEYRRTEPKTYTQ